MTQVLIFKPDKHYVKVTKYKAVMLINVNEYTMIMFVLFFFASDVHNQINGSVKWRTV